MPRPDLDPRYEARFFRALQSFSKGVEMMKSIRHEEESNGLRTMIATGARGWLMLTIGLFLAAPLAHATLLAPGAGPTAPSTYPLVSNRGQPLDASPSQRLAFKTNNVFGTLNAQATTTATGGYVFEAISDPNNVFCAGCIDILFQVGVDFGSLANVTRVTLSGFTGYLTDVGYDFTSIGGRSECGPADNGYCDSQAVPTTVDRLAADVIGFDFGAGIVPRDASPTLVIETNALTFVDPAGLSVYASDGSKVEALGQVFMPAGPPVAVPLPLPALLLGSGLLGLLGRRRR
jgi:hypothetical protein